MSYVMTSEQAYSVGVVIQSWCTHKMFRNNYVGSNCLVT